MSNVLALPDSVGGGTIRWDGPPDDPQMYAVDVCARVGVIGKNAVAKAIARLDPADVIFPPSEGKIPGRGRPRLYDNCRVKESAAYELILTSRAPNSRPLLHLVTREILPSIRRHGCYPPPGPTATVSQADGGDEDDPILASLTRYADMRRAQLVMERQLRHVASLAHDAGVRAQAAIDTAINNQGCYTVLGWKRLQGQTVSGKEAAAMGKKASALCRARGIKVEKVRDGRYGEVGLYPEGVLEQVLGPLQAKTTPALSLFPQEA